MRQKYATGSIVVLSGLLAIPACDSAFLAEFRTNFRSQLATPADGQMCGDRTGVSVLVSDCPAEGLCFTSACQEHDQCYAGCAVTRAECDRRFRSAMNDICAAQYALGDPMFRECLYFAHLYWSIVELNGVDFFVCEDVQSPAPQPGACCHAADGGSCEEVALQSECALDDVFVPGLTCNDVNDELGGCPAPPSDDCQNATRVCEGQAAGVGLGWCDDDGESGRICSVSSQDCVLAEACLPHEHAAFRCIVPSDNRLATTDGPGAGQLCGFDKPNVFQADVWYEYVASCTGTLSIQMCNATFYDSILAVYGTEAPSAGCVCPQNDAALLACDDDGCGGFANPSIATLPVVANACYLIRVGGWSADGTVGGAARGICRLDIGLLCDEGASN